MPRSRARTSESSQSGLANSEDIEVEMTGYNGNSPIVSSSSDDHDDGCHVTYIKGFIIVLAACVLSVVVGLIVGLAHPAIHKSCPNLAPTPGPDHLWQTCVNMSWEKGECLPGLVCTSPLPTQTSPTQTPSLPPSLNIRLPTSIVPTHYNIRIRPDIYQPKPEAFTFQGWTEVYMKCLEPTRSIVLHTKLLNRTSQELKDANGNKLNIFDISEDPIRDFLTIVAKDDLKVGEEYMLSVSYSGPITNDLKGIYYSSYTTGSQTKYLMTSQIQPINARKVFPCFDEPALKATYNISIERKPDFTSMSNTNIIKTERLSGGWERDTFASTPKMSAYILAFTVSQFDCVPSNTTDGKLAQICCRPDVINQAEFAASIAGKLQGFYEYYHNITIPVPKMGHVGVPDFAFGAMENWGLIIYRESRLLYDPASSTAYAKQKVAAIIAHELAHMWFGNLVTPIWWDDVWLNEGFASYFEAVGVADIFPAWQMHNYAIREDLMRAFPVDSQVTSHPVYQKVDNPADISQIFDTITYSKGAAIIRMMKYFLGEETFRWGLAKYLEGNAYQGTDHKQLFKYLTEQATADGKNINVTSIMKTWILQTGFPVVDYWYDAMSGEVRLTQNRFLFNTVQMAKTENPLWEIPISIVSLPSADEDATWDHVIHGWLKERTDVIKVPITAEWIIGNVKFQYFYRVNYDSMNWDALRRQLVTNHTKIDVANRVQIVDDAFNLGRPGIVDQILPLNISRYMKNETDYLPWEAADKGFHYLDIMFDLTSQYGLLKKYVQTLVAKVYTSVGWLDDDSQEHIERLLRGTILDMACHYGLRDCTDYAAKLYKNWMKNDVKIAAGIQPLVFCQGVRMGGDEEWEFAFSKYLSPESAAQSRNLLEALTCTREDWLLRRVLALALEEKHIRRQDFDTTVALVAKNPIGRHLAWEFLKTNWDIIFERFGDMTFSFADIIEGVTVAFSTQHDLNEVLEFMDTHPELGTSQEAFKHAKESISDNIVWRTENEEKIFKWLEKEQ